MLITLKTNADRFDFKYKIKVLACHYIYEFNTFYSQYSFDDKKI